MYQEIKDENGLLIAIKRISDGAIIPINTNNSDYQVYLGWIFDGNTPQPDPNYTLVNVKARALNIVRRQAGQQISMVGEWTMERQQNASDGFYDPSHPGTKAACINYRGSIITQSNAYEDAINTATAIVNIDAIVASVTWDITGLFNYSQTKVFI